MILYLIAWIYKIKIIIMTVNYKSYQFKMFNGFSKFLHWASIGFTGGQGGLYILGSVKFIKFSRLKIF